MAYSGNHQIFNKVASKPKICSQMNDLDKTVRHTTFSLLQISCFFMYREAAFVVIVRRA